VGDKLLIKIAKPYLIGAIICFVAVMFLLAYTQISWKLALPCAAACYIVFALIVRFVLRGTVIDALTAANGEIEETLRYSVAHNPFPLCIVNGEGVVAMSNDGFREIFPQAKILISTAEELVGSEKLSELKEGGASVFVEADGRVFRALASYVNKSVSESAILYFVDETPLREMQKLYEDGKTCYCDLIVDNYEDSLQASPDENRSMRAAAIEALIRGFADEVEGSILRYRSGAWLIVFPRKHYAKLAAGKFPVLDAARSLETDADFPTSLSLGIGLGDTPDVSAEYARYALDLARGRGGDQAVVKSADSLDYFGGRVQVIENRNKGKSRVMSHAIRQLITDAQNVLIMGHKYADIDSFAATCAMSRMATARGKEAYVVISGYNHSLADVYQLAAETGRYRFITGDEALKLASPGTLLIVIDTHTPTMTDDPRLLGRTEKMVIIDHHRRRESVIEGATVSYMEPNASSSSELVTELLQFDDETRKIDKFEAEMLLGGIFIDTNSFSVKTGARTFEAAAWLRMNGADTTNVRGWLQSDMEDFRQRASITANASFSKSGIAISRSDGVHDNAQIICAQSADELLDIKGIRASFVVGATKKEIVISARSLGDLNVQLIMERFGGGGHLTMAAAQIPDATIDGVIKKLKQYIKEAEGENI